MRHKPKAVDTIRAESKGGGNGEGRGCHNGHFIHHKGGYLGGNGCKAHPDCFTCPFKECKWESNDTYI